MYVKRVMSIGLNKQILTLILHVLNHSSVEESMLKLVVKIILKLSQTFQSLFTPDSLILFPKM